MNTLITLILILSGSFTLYSMSDDIEIIETTQIMGLKGDDTEYSEIKKVLKDITDNDKFNIKDIISLVRNNEELKKALDVIKNNDEIKEILDINNDEINNVEDISDKLNEINENKDFIKFKIHDESCNCLSICKNKTPSIVLLKDNI